MLLSAEQKKRICILARTAWARMPDSEKDEYRQIDGGQTETNAFNFWRHAQQSVAVGRLNLTASENDEFAILMAHFAMLANESKTASFWLMRYSTDDRRRVFWLIQQSCSDGIDFPKYPDKIAQVQYKCRLWHCTINQLFNILSTVRNRVNAKRKAINSQQMELGL